MRRTLAAAITAAAVLTGCGESSSYDAAEAGLRDWLVAAHQGDEAACDHMTAEYRRSLSVDHAGCDLDLPALPPADAAMTVPAWDSSGEALVEVEGGPDFWMRFEDDRWLVAGSPD